MSYGKAEADTEKKLGKIQGQSQGIYRENQGWAGAHTADELGGQGRYDAEPGQIQGESQRRYMESQTDTGKDKGKYRGRFIGR